MGARVAPVRCGSAPVLYGDSAGMMAVGTTGTTAGRRTDSIAAKLSLDQAAMGHMALVSAETGRAVR